MAKMVSTSEMIEALGKEEYQKLCDRFAGGSHYFRKDPNAIDFPDQASKEQYIRNLFYSSKTPQEIADLMNMSVDRIGKIINKR